MAPPALRPWAWAVAVALAAGGLAALALHVARPDSALVRFQAAGVMQGIAPDDVTEARVTAGTRGWRFTRGDDGGWRAAAAAQDAARVADGVRLLHASAPQRTLEQQELGDARLAEFGLDPPRYVVTVIAPGHAAFSVRFGDSNPQGLAQYAQVAGRHELVLLPRYVGEAWEAATGLR